MPEFELHYTQDIVFGPNEDKFDIRQPPLWQIDKYTCEEFVRDIQPSVNRDKMTRGKGEARPDVQLTLAHGIHTKPPAF